MNNELIVIVILSFLNVFQLLFWSIQNRKLIDRLMSRNYAEYVQAEHLVKASPTEYQTQTPQFIEDPELNELNARLGGM